MLVFLGLKVDTNCNIFLFPLLSVFRSSQISLFIPFVVKIGR